MLLFAVTHAAATALPVAPILHSPLPVSVKNWPGPDEVATKTLQVANRTLIASIVAIAVGVFAIGVAIFDAWNGRRELNLILEERRRAPMLFVTGTTTYLRQVFTARPEQPQDAYAVDLSLRLTNAEQAPFHRE
jgi:hypothetical protein